MSLDQTHTHRNLRNAFKFETKSEFGMFFFYRKSLEYEEVRNNLKNRFCWEIRKLIVISVVVVVENNTKKSAFIWEQNYLSLFYFFIHRHTFIRFWIRNEKEEEDTIICCQANFSV